MDDTYGQMKAEVAYRKEQAERIYNGDADNYDGADGARYVLKLCKICEALFKLIDNPSLLKDVEQALDDWITTYAADHCSPEHVQSAWKRILDNGGTLAYVTDLRERVSKAIATQE